MATKKKYTPNSIQPQSIGGREGLGKPKPMQYAPQSLLGREGNGFAQAAQSLVNKPTTSGIIPVTGQNSSIIPVSGQAPVGSELDQLLAAIGKRSFNKTTFGVSAPGSSKSASERAALAVNSQFAGKSETIQKRMGLLDQQLRTGQQVQKDYGQIGDSKLASIYDNLKNVATATADSTKTLYDGAATNVGSTYTAADATIKGNATAAQTTLEKELQGLGLQQALPEASAAVQETVQQDSDANAAAKANSLANIITLGANMGAAALQDVNIVATLGANTRKDLVNSVQSTLAKLQEEHDTATADLSAQLSELEAQRSAALQQATTQYEADDADKKYNYELQKAQFEADQNKQELDFERNNLSDMLGVLNAQDERSNKEFSNNLASQSMILQQQQQEINRLNDERNWEIQAKTLNLNVDQFKQQQITDKWKRDMDEKGLTLEWEKMTLEQQNAKARDWYNEQQIAISKGDNAIAQQNADTSKQSAQANINQGQAQLDEQKRKNLEDARLEQLRIDLTAKGKAATPQDVAKAQAEIDKNKALTEKYIAETDVAKAKAKATGKKEIDYGKGPAGFAKYSAAYSDKKKHPKTYAAIKEAEIIIAESSANPPLTGGTLYEQTLAMALERGSAPQTLKAIQIWFGK
jgi:hypothetical protein